MNKVDVHVEEGNPLTASDSYTVNGTTNMALVTTLKFPVPNVIAQNLGSGHPMLFTLTIEVQAQWPTRGGGLFRSMVLDASALFASSLITAPTIGRGSMIYKVVAVGAIKTVKALADMFKLTISWETNSWYEGEDTYGFDVVYSVTAVDSEFKLGTAPLGSPEAVDACSLAEGPLSESTASISLGETDSFSTDRKSVV